MCITEPPYPVATAAEDRAAGTFAVIPRGQNGRTRVHSEFRTFIEHRTQLILFSILFIPMKGGSTVSEHYRAPPSSRPSAFSSAAARHSVALRPACASFEGPRPPALAPHRRHPNVPIAAVAIAAVVAGAGAPPRRTQELERALRKTGIALLAWLLIVTNQITHKTNTCTKTSVSIKTSVSVKNQCLSQKPLRQWRCAALLRTFLPVVRPTVGARVLPWSTRTVRRGAAHVRVQPASHRRISSRSLLFAGPGRGAPQDGPPPPASAASRPRSRRCTTTPGASSGARRPPRQPEQRRPLL